MPQVFCFCGTGQRKKGMGIVMKKQFFVRLCSLIVMAACVGIYQINASAWEKKEADNQKKIAKIEKYNNDILRKEGKLKNTYKDGIYEAKAMGFGGDILVKVDVSDGQIKEIEVVKAEKEDSAYLTAAKAIIDTMIDRQNTNVDTVSGATYSSTGIKNAVTEALKDAVEES